MTVSMGTSLWRTSDSGLERMKWLCPTHIPHILPEPWDGLKGRMEKDQETKVEDSA